MSRTPELLSPAGDPEKLRAALRYGADAVYCAGQLFGMRAAAANFTDEELAAAAETCHALGRKLYITVNILPRDAEYPALARYLSFLASIRVDAVILSDLGVLELVREKTPGLPIHISTQASTVSAAACRAWHRLGASRIVLARELTLGEIRTIRQNIPPELELEAFVHGAMCIAYSGRCLLSNYFVGRDANHGACAQPCRWVYHPVQELTVAEEKRPDQSLPVMEENGDTFVMSSRDTCMIEHVPELIDAGITSFKIEGRVKSAYYTAVTANAYRMAIDACLADPAGYRFDPAWLQELCSVSHRPYGTGFYFGSPHERANTAGESGYIREKAYLATAFTDRGADGFASFVQRNKFSLGDTLEWLTPGQIGKAFRATELTDEEGVPLTATPHPGMRFRLRVPYPVRVGDIIRQGEEPQ